MCLKISKFLENLPGKSKFFVKLPEKIEISRKFAWKNRNLVDPVTRIHDPQISNQIDASELS